MTPKQALKWIEKRNMACPFPPCNDSAPVEVTDDDGRPLLVHSCGLEIDLKSDDPVCDCCSLQLPEEDAHRGHNEDADPTDDCYHEECCSECNAAKEFARFGRVA